MSGYTERATTRRRQAGFTLIEVMVAIMLMAIVSLMAWRGLDSMPGPARTWRTAPSRAPRYCAR